MQPKSKFVAESNLFSFLICVAEVVFLLKSTLDGSGEWSEIDVSSLSGFEAYCHFNLLSLRIIDLNFFRPVHFSVVDNQSVVFEGLVDVGLMARLHCWHHFH